MKYTNIIKIIFSIIISLVCFLIYKKYQLLLFGFIELILIYFITQIIIKKHRLLGNILNGVLQLLYNFNILIYIFSNSFLTYVMIQNISSIEILGSKLIIYIFSFFLVLLLSCLPVKYYDNKKAITHFIVTVIVYITLIIYIGYKYVPLYNYSILINTFINDFSMKQKIKNVNSDEKEFINPGVSNYITYDSSLGSHPNIILIFSEGMSQHVITDKRNVVPNIKKYKDKSISFSNYYNHTAPTYRGIIGQLYSGYQYNNTDVNKLISLENILNKHGYDTRFINVEPTNQEFTDYLNTLGFNKVMPYLIEESNGGEEFDYLYKLAIKLNSKKKPFFISIYTVETHIGWDSKDKCFDNCSNRFLNRFYNYDYYFGEFMNKFINSKLYDNTIVIFTTDHASYDDQDFRSAFPNEKREFNFLDDIPLYIFHKNVEARSIDVKGRNSLDLAPTILDYIDISDINYFLGDSLFSNEYNKSKYDYMYYAPGCYFTSEYSEINGIYNEEQNKFEQELLKYFSLATEK